MTLETRFPTSSKPLSLPIITGRPLPVESPLSRWADASLSSAVSPSNSYPRFGVQAQLLDYRSPSDVVDPDRSPLPHARRSGSGSTMDLRDDASSVTSQSRDSYDQRISPDQDIDFQMEEGGLRRLKIEEYTRAEPYSPSITSGQKRRASSPPGEDEPALHTTGSAGDLFRRRESGSRTSPGPRFHSSSGSVSSTASGPRSNSYASTTFSSIGASSITSMNSYGRLSPGGLSPVPTDGSDSPYVTSISLNPSPRGSLSRTHHHRTLSESRPIMTSRQLSESLILPKQKGTSTIQDVFICECCPKKPRKFDSQEKLKYIPLY